MGKTTSMENDETEYLKWKSYFRIKPYERNDRGNIRAMYYDNNKKLDINRKFPSTMSNLHTKFYSDTQAQNWTTAQEPSVSSFKYREIIWFSTFVWNLMPIVNYTYSTKKVRDVTESVELYHTTMTHCCNSAYYPHLHCRSTYPSALSSNETPAKYFKIGQP